MKKTITRIMTLVLVLVMCFNITVPSFAASKTTFYTTEVYGGEGRTYITVKNKVPLRAFPANDGKVLEKLPENYPLEAEGLYRTKKGTMWIRVATPDYPEAWVFCGNIEEHQCTMVDLGDYGYDGFEFCKVCGHLAPTSLDAFTTNYEAIHIMLGIMSLVPGIGNAFDVLDGLVALVEGDEAAALMSFGAAVPFVGYGGNAVKVGKTLDVATGKGGVVATVYRVSDDMVEIYAVPSSRLLRQNLDYRYALTLDDRFYNYSDYFLPKRSIAAHHIVGGTAADAKIAREILQKVGIGINSAENGVYLCMKTSICIDDAIHAGRHSKEYFDEVNRVIQEAYNGAKGTGGLTKSEAQRIAVVEALDGLARRLMSGDLKLN